MVPAATAASTLMPRACNAAVISAVSSLKRALVMVTGPSHERGQQQRPVGEALGTGQRHRAAHRSLERREGQGIGQRVIGKGPLRQWAGSSTADATEAA